MNALSLFSGGGIGETYLKEIGVNVVVANEIDERRAEFYKFIYPNTDMICGDITDDDIYNEIINQSKANCVDLIIATPPCQGMSIAGKQVEFDERNQLICNAVDAVLDIMPKFAVFENVPEQENTYIKYNNRRTLVPRYIERRLGRFYHIKSSVLNAKDYGVPQHRKRLFFVLVRRDLNFEYTFPTVSNEITLSQAFAGIPDLWPNIREKKYQNVLPKNSEESLDFHRYHKPPTHSWRNVECMLFTPTGKSAMANKKYKPLNRNGKLIKSYDSTFKRMVWEKPANTLTKSNGMLGSTSTAHPGKPCLRTKDGTILYNNPRVLTLYEVMVVSSLPDDWTIPSFASDNLTRFVIGESVPPLLLKKVVEGLI